MPMFMLERQFAEQLDLDQAEAETVHAASLDEGLRWVFSFLSADRMKTYCLFEAVSADVLRAAAEKANLAHDVVIAITEIDSLGQGLSAGASDASAPIGS